MADTESIDIDIELIDAEVIDAELSDVEHARPIVDLERAIEAILMIAD